MTRIVDYRAWLPECPQLLKLFRACSLSQVKAQAEFDRLGPICRGTLYAKLCAYVQVPVGQEPVTLSEQDLPWLGLVVQRAGLKIFRSLSTQECVSVKMLACLLGDSDEGVDPGVLLRALAAMSLGTAYFSSVLDRLDDRLDSLERATAHALQRMGQPSAQLPQEQNRAPLRDSREFLEQLKQRAFRLEQLDRAHCLARLSYPEVLTALDEWIEEALKEHPGLTVSLQRAFKEVCRFLSEENSCKLDLGDLCLPSLPSIFDRPPFTERLRTLRCSHNQLVFLPDGLGECSALCVLDCASNCLVALPADLARCSALQELRASANCITDLPVELLALSHGCILYLDDCPLLKPPVRGQWESAAADPAYRGPRVRFSARDADAAPASRHWMALAIARSSQTARKIENVHD
jgi:hypothetical protein